MNIKTASGGILVGCGSNWTTNLAQAIKDIEHGKELVVNSHAKRELAIRAIQRQRPHDGIRVTIQP